jgi:hypothetical protein
MTPFQVILAPLCACAAAAMLWRTARGYNPRRYGLFWAFVWLTAGFLILDPVVTTKIAGWLGIARGADLLLYFAILTGLAGSSYFYVKHHRLEVMVTEIIRREALRSAVHGARTKQVTADRLAASSPSREAELLPRGVERS